MLGQVNQFGGFADAAQRRFRDGFGLAREVITLRLWSASLSRSSR